MLKAFKLSSLILIPLEVELEIGLIQLLNLETEML